MTKEELLEKYHFFWSGPLSQWSVCKFTMRGIGYNCAEQAMMHMKAVKFNDFEMAERILSSCNPGEQKNLGRQVRNYNDIIWSEHRYDIVLEISKAKFNQSERHKEILMSTNDKEIVEASPYDTIWGIGMGVNEAMKTDPMDWKGYNLLGQALTQTRNNMR